MLKVPCALLVLVLMVPGVLGAEGRQQAARGVIAGQVVDGVTGEPVGAVVVSLRSALVAYESRGRWLKIDGVESKTLDRVLR